MSDLVNAIPRKDIIQRLIKKRKASEKLDMVDIKHRHKLTETEVSRILGEKKLYAQICFLNDSQNWKEIIIENVQEIISFNIYINNVNLISTFNEEEFKNFKKKILQLQKNYSSFIYNWFSQCFCFNKHVNTT